MSAQLKSTTRGRNACTACRQVKLRCDGNQTFPAACSRCRQNGLDCRTDPAFKRAKTRHRLEEVTSQLTAIQKTLGLVPSTFSTSTDNAPLNQSLSPLAETTIGSASSYSTFHSPPEPIYSIPQEISFFRGVSSRGFPAGAISIGNVSIEISQVETLFTQFKEYKYSHCPILDVELSIYDLYQTSSFLFWTIIIIASRCHESDDQSHKSLLLPFRQLLGEVLVGPILSIEPLQGLCLLCMWPLPVVKQIEDPTWNYSGLLVNAVIRLGLHRSTSGVGTPKFSDKEARRRAKTWMAILQVSSTYVWSSGQSLPLSLSDETPTLEVPLTQSENDFLIKYRIQRQSVKCTMLMHSLNEAQDCFPFAQILCKDLEEIKTTTSKSWNIECKIKLLGAQLSIYGFLIQQRPLQPGTRFGMPHTETSKQTLIQLGFSTAIRIIHIFSMTRQETPQQSPSSPSSIHPKTPQIHLPKH